MYPSIGNELVYSSVRSRASVNVNSSNIYIHSSFPNKYYNIGISLVQVQVRVRVSNLRLNEMCRMKMKVKRQMTNNPGAGKL